jgi:hypothetical protein
MWLNKMFFFKKTQFQEEQETINKDEVKKEIKIVNIVQVAVVFMYGSKGFFGNESFSAFNHEGKLVQKISKQARVKAANGRYPLGKIIGKTGKHRWQKVHDAYLVNFINKEKFLKNLNEKRDTPDEIEWLFTKANLYKEFENDDNINIDKIILKNKAEREKRAEEERKEARKQARKRREKEEQRKNTLIKKYGKEDGTLIFKGKLTENECIRKNNLIEKYGDEFGLAVFNNKLLKGMKKGMVADSIGNPQYKDKDKWYFGNPFNKYILFEKNKVSKECKLSEGIWLDMPKVMLVASYGKPKDEKKTVSKKSIKLKWYYGERITQQYNYAYNLEVRLENDLVVGWKELE